MGLGLRSRYLPSFSCLMHHVLSCPRLVILCLSFVLWLVLSRLVYFVLFYGVVLSVIMSSSPEEYVPPVVPNCISASYAQELKEEVRAMVPGNIKEFYPEVVVSYGLVWSLCFVLWLVSCLPFPCLVKDSVLSYVYSYVLSCLVPCALSCLIFRLRG